MEGRVGWMFGNFIKRVCTVAWCLTGLAAVVYFGGRELDPDRIFGLVAADFLPKILPGVLGLFLASLLASVMSSCDSFMIASSGLFTENIYKRLKPEKSQKHYVLVARVTSLVIVAGGVAFAYWLPSVVEGLEIFWKISPMMGIAFWLGLFWRRTSVAGAWASTLIAFGVWFLTTLGAVIWLTGQVPYAKEARLLFVKEDKPVLVLGDCHLKDASSLAIKLREGKDPLSAHIHTKLSQETQELLAQYDSNRAVSKELREKLVEELNKLVTEGKLGIAYEQMSEKEKCEVFYEASRFAHVELSQRTQELISREPEGKALVRLNRRLLEEAYSEEIARSWLFCECDIKEPVALARRVMKGEEPVCLYVRKRLSEESRRLLANPDSVEPEVLKEAIATDFNRIASGKNIYDEHRFDKVVTSEATIKLAQKEPSGEDLILVNNYLLEEAFIWEVSKNRKIEIYLPWQMVFYLTAGLLTGIVVSLFTRPVAREKLDNFYALVRTPIKPGEQVPAPCTLPADAVVPEKRNIFPNTNFEISIPSRTSVFGFLAGWGCVAAIIYSVYLIARM